MTAFYQKRCSSQTTSQDGKGSIEKQHEYENFQHCIPLYLFSNDQQVRTHMQTHYCPLFFSHVEKYLLTWNRKLHKR